MAAVRNSKKPVGKTKLHKVMLSSYSQSLTFNIDLTEREADLLYDIQEATKDASICLILDPDTK